MQNYILHDPWQIIEKGFNPESNKIIESLCSIGNGRMGQRANFEEKYSGDSMQGSYVAGVYYPDKTRVGWWKNGYPNYFAKVLNACNWIGINVMVGKDELDLATSKVSFFKRVLDMKEGVLYRNFTAELAQGQQIKVAAQRFCSIADDEIGAIRYGITSLNFNGTLTLSPYLDGDIKNSDANYGDKFWNEVARESDTGEAYLNLATKQNDFGVDIFQVATGMSFEVYKNGNKLDLDIAETDREKYVANTVKIKVVAGDEVVIYKYAANVSSMNYTTVKLMGACRKAVHRTASTGFDTLLQYQKAAWAAKWEESDITIEGDVAAQQGIRFNIFQMNQTYTGEDERLNIGPKGFTGEKYGGSTYWDTEAYCLPFYLSTTDPKVARQLLVYRHKHLPKAIENAEKLGFKNGAALYPMVTMNGEECHNEWEITFEEIHRNGAIAFAIYDYIRYTGDEDYLAEYGLEVLMGISRFWSQRVNFSKSKNKYVMLGVTGPNEYENNVNNNWYTNYIACWCMGYCQSALDWVKTEHPKQYAAIIAKTKFEESETARWKDIRNNMYFPFDSERNIYLQQDNFLDKEITTMAELNPAEYPIHQNWSWDRILRSCYIKQADTLQGMYLFEDHFDADTIRRHFDFYEPLTVHESSLSPCVHVILAAKLGYQEKAYELYMRTSRLDLDDYNNDAKDGCHITSMAGTWMAVTKGFGGMRVKDGHLHFNPFVPEQWQSFAFKVRFRGHLLKIEASKGKVQIVNETRKELTVFVFGQSYQVGNGLTVEE